MMEQRSGYNVEVPGGFTRSDFTRSDYTRKISRSWGDTVRELSDEEAGKVFKAMFAAMHGKVQTSSLGLSPQAKVFLDKALASFAIEDPVIRSYKKALIKKELER